MAISGVQKPRGPQQRPGAQEQMPVVLRHKPNDLRLESLDFFRKKMAEDWRN